MAYLSGQPLVGVNPDPKRWDGQLLPFRVGQLGKVMREVRRLADEGLGVLFTTHDPNHALRFADLALLIRDGRPLASGPAPAVIDGPRLEALYGSPVLALRDPLSGEQAFLPA